MKNRIVRVGMADPAELTAHSLNWRDHPISQSKALVTVLDRLGWIKRVVVNERTGRIIDGHLRVEEAQKAGEKVPVVWVNLSEREEALVLAMFDPLAGDAATDDQKLGELLSAILETGDLDQALADLLREVAKNGGVMLQTAEEQAGEESGTPEPVRCPRCGHEW